MDYGKLAYLKAVDLEDRLNLTKGAQFSVFTADFTALPQGLSYLTEIQGNGDIAVFINSSLPAVFYVDGVKICQGDKVFFKLNDGGRITVDSQSSLDKLSLMVMGDIVSAEKAGASNFDYNGSQISYIVSENGKVLAYVFDVSAFEPVKLFEGMFLHGDICAYENGFLLAVTDGKGTVRTIASDGKQYDYHINADRVAVNADDFLITIAFVRGGELFYFEIEDFAQQLPTLNKITYNGYVDDVKFVKKGSKLLFAADGKCFVKEMAKSSANKDKVYVKLIAEVL